MDFLKTMTGKVVSGLVGLAVIAAGISWWQMDPATRQMLVSGTGKTYEGLLTALWYIGPMQHAPGFDFTGSANGPLTLHYAGIYLALSGALFVVAFTARARQLSSLQ